LKELANDPDSFISNAEAERTAALNASRATDAAVELPVPDGLSYLPYQRAGIAYALGHPSVLFGDEMGLGKTIQAIGIINSDPSIKRVLVICPASLKLNWRNELRKWLVREMSIGIAQGKEFPESDVVIINYDILTKHDPKIKAIEWDLVVCDEMHYLKSPDAQRTRAVIGFNSKGKGKDVAPICGRRRIGLTGTPIPNRPIELFPSQVIFGRTCFPVSSASPSDIATRTTAAMAGISPAHLIWASFRKSCDVQVWSAD
jgi:SWI/SNF-related matrix-associated actin-dependent regulator 1 of chromatin subfamily A